MVSATTVKLYEHQQRAVAFLAERDGKAGLFLEARTGKTRVALAYLLSRAERILVVGRINFIEVWSREATALGSATPLFIGAGRSVTAQAGVLRSAGGGVFATNYEAYWREPLRSAILKWQPDAVVLDEAHGIKHAGSRQSRFAHLLADRPFVRYRLALTGTPITNGLQDAYSLYRFIDPSVFGRRWIDFERRYIVRGGYEMREIKGYRNEAEAQRLIAATSYRVLRSACFDLPPTQNTVVPIDLSLSSRRVYADLKRHSIAQLAEAKGTVVARIALTAILRLQQLTSGHCTTEEGHVVDIGDEKLSACEELVDDLLAGGEKVVVFCRFRRDYQRVTARLNQHGVDALTGETPPKARRRLLPGGRWEAKNPIIVCQIDVGSLGIDLSAASAAVFYSTGFKLDSFEQAKDRLQGLAQTKQVGYYYLVAKQTVDEKVYAALAAKQRVADFLVDGVESRRFLEEATV